MLTLQMWYRAEHPRPTPSKSLGSQEAAAPESCDKARTCSTIHHNNKQTSVRVRFCTAGVKYTQKRTGMRGQKATRAVPCPFSAAMKQHLGAGAWVCALGFYLVVCERCWIT